MGDFRDNLPGAAHGSGYGALEQTALLRSLFVDAPVGFGLVDTAYRYVVVNNHLADMHGLSAADHAGRLVAEVVPHLWSVLEPMYRRVLVEAIPLERIESGPDPKDPRRMGHWRVSYFPVREGQRVVGIGVLVHDIAESVRHREALRTLTDLYAMMSRTNRAVLDCTTRDELFSALCRIAVETGHFRFAWIGVPVDGRICPVAWSGDGREHMPDILVTIDDDDPRSLGPTGQAFITGASVVVNDFLNSPATERWHDLAARAGFASVAAFPLKEHGRVVAALTLRSEQVGFFTPDLVDALNEITPSVSMALDAFLREAHMKRDNAELRLKDRAIRATPHGICISDAQVAGNPLIFVSPGFERITGYAPEEVIGRNCRFLQGVETDPNAVALVRDALAQAKSCTVELLNYRKDGTTFLNELTISPVTDDDGTLTNFVGVIADVTERRRLEQQILNVQKMEAVGQLASGVAHDFNNVLTVIDGCSELLLDAMASADASRELVEEIRKAGAHGGTLTRQLLAFSRRQVVTPTVLDLNTIVTGSERMIRRLIGEDVSLSTHLHTPLGHVVCDAGQLEQVLINLAVNARDAMPTGGRLTISTGMSTLSAVDGDAPPGAYVTLEVRDTGIGMDEATRRQMFEPFFTTKLPGRGTGLGLSTVHSIVLQAGGRISVESQVDVGTAFRLYFPRAADAPLVDPSRMPLYELPRGTETVLLAEDDAGVRAFSHRVLARAGYTVLDAVDGAEALSIAWSYVAPIHLLITDVVMPNLGGWELALTLARLRPDCKVLFLSGYTHDEVVRHGVVESDVAFLQKPFAAASLAEKVRAVLDNRL